MALLVDANGVFCPQQHVDDILEKLGDSHPELVKFVRDQFEDLLRDEIVSGAPASLALD